MEFTLCNEVIIDVEAWDRTSFGYDWAWEVHGSLIFELIILERGVKYGEMSLLAPLLKYFDILCF